MAQHPPTVVDEKSKVLALVAWASAFTGMPLFIIPLVLRDDAFAVSLVRPCPS